MIYIATNVNHSYFQSKHADWIRSVVKYKNPNEQCMMFSMGFDAMIDNVITVPIELNEIQNSKHPNIKNRKEFVCLESGEFINFYNFKDDDIVILCDWDVTMQKSLDLNELDIINTLGNTVGMNRDHYPVNYLYNNTLNYLGIGNIFNDIDQNWIVYNTGVQTATVSTWRTIYNYWKELAPIMFEKCTHHAAGQALFNYIIQKYNIVMEMPLTYHNADWFTGTPSRVINNQLFVNDKLVTFNHHKWRFRPTF